MLVMVVALMSASKLCLADTSSRICFSNDVNRFPWYLHLLRSGALCHGTVCTVPPIIGTPGVTQLGTFRDAYGTSCSCSYTKLPLVRSQMKRGHRRILNNYSRHSSRIATVATAGGLGHYWHIILPNLITDLQMYTTEKYDLINHLQKGLIWNLPWNLVKILLIHNQSGPQ